MIKGDFQDTLEYLALNSLKKQETMSSVIDIILRQVSFETWFSLTLTHFNKVHGIVNLRSL